MNIWTGFRSEEHHGQGNRLVNGFGYRQMRPSASNQGKQWFWKPFRPDWAGGLFIVGWTGIAFGQWWVSGSAEVGGWLLWGTVHQNIARHPRWLWMNGLGAMITAWGQTGSVVEEMSNLHLSFWETAGLSALALFLWAGTYWLPAGFWWWTGGRKVSGWSLAGLIWLGILLGDWIRNLALGFEWVGPTLWGWETWLWGGLWSGLTLWAGLTWQKYLTVRRSRPVSWAVVAHTAEWDWAWVRLTLVGGMVLGGLAVVLGGLSGSVPMIAGRAVGGTAASVGGTAASIPPCLLIVAETFAPPGHVPDWTGALRGRLRQRLESMQAMLDRHMMEQGSPPPQYLLVWPEWGRQLPPVVPRGAAVYPHYDDDHGQLRAQILWQLPEGQWGRRGKYRLTPVGERSCLGIAPPSFLPAAPGSFPPLIFWQGRWWQSLLCVEALYLPFWTGPGEILTVSANWQSLSRHHRRQFTSVLARRAVKHGKTVVLSAHGHPGGVWTPQGALHPIWVSETIADDHQPLWVRFRVFVLPE